MKALEREKRLVPPQPSPAEAGRPDEGASALEIREWLSQALGRLSADQRLVVELTFFEGCSYQEIAEIADCPVNTVKTRMFHARHRLRDILVSLDPVALEKAP